MTKRESINVVWFKRDLRLHDNEAIWNALQGDKPVLLLYVFEHILLNDPHYDARHWNFIKQSLQDINSELEQYNSKVLIVNSDITSAFNQIQNLYKVEKVFSHQETGIEITYQRDKDFTRYCRNNSIEWVENINNGVIRGLKNRVEWFENWNAYMEKDQLSFKVEESQLLSASDIEELENYFSPYSIETTKNKSFQKGGRTTGLKYAQTFFESRHEEYMHQISKPEKSRYHCSRLSPYFAWGNLSVREIYQKGQKVKNNHNRRHIGAFISRLRWQAHFIQKFEMEHTMEHASVNKGYHKLKKSISEKYQEAWQNGLTGFPLVDASMRCLQETGYLNFRMRALVVSFFTHILWQPWQAATTHLSKLFLDFEPGIHFPQMQMQAGETGINNLRIYNPIKNGMDHDEEAVFIKKWVPELRNLDTQFAHQPYLMTTLEQNMYNFELGKDYPAPIVDIKSSRKFASDILWNMKEDPEVKKESERILKRHTLANRNRMLQGD